MKFENSWVGNIEGAFRGLRFPMNSNGSSDSKVDPDTGEFIIGEKDMNLAHRMIKAGSPNDKFLRQIPVSVDITAPDFFFKELSTYKVGTVENSSSTMHKLATTPITTECFEPLEKSDKGLIIRDKNLDSVDEAFQIVVDICESLRQRYIETHDERYWTALITTLPMGWLYKRHWTANYSILRNVIHWRQTHKLKQWSVYFMDWCKSLPYSEELLFYCNEPGENG